MNHPRTLITGFLESSRRVPDRVALGVGERELTYAELRRIASRLARASAVTTGPRLVAIFGYRSVTAYAGVVGALMAGCGYVPLNRTFPVDRTRAMMLRSGCTTVIVDGESALQLDDLLEGISSSLTVVLPEADDVRDLAMRWPAHRFLSSTDLQEELDPRAADPDAIAYLLFTSGSTGVPKGVMVAHRNVLPFVDSMVERYAISESDRFSQTFDMTFDLSVFDMFVAWEAGASVHCPDQAELIQPGRFINRAGLTVWFSVPSTGMFMRRLGALKPGRYPTLRWTLFCGEPLPVAVAQAWAEAAPGSKVENLYGPTEVTIACTLYRWDPASSPAECERDLVPIGHPYPGMTTLVADEQLMPVAEGEVGELLLSGPQVTPGYWNDPEKTAEAFVTPPGGETVHYRTGDLVRKRTPVGPLVFVRRKDHQIKIQGHRVELGEIEAVLRRESGVDAVVALGWPVTDQGVGGVVAFIGSEDVDVDAVTARCRRQLPTYMVPRALHLRERLPLNSNGKFDRPALLTILEDQTS